MSTHDDQLANLIECLRDDFQEWLALVAKPCIELAEQIGPPAVSATLAELRTTRDNYVALHCVQLLARLRMEEACDAMADVLDIPLADEVFEQIFEDAVDTSSLKQHPRFIAKASQLRARWPHPELDRFLEAVQREEQ